MTRRNAHARLLRKSLPVLVERVLFSSAAVALSGAALPAQSLAATISVNSIMDPGNAGTCTLRQAVVSMVAGSVAGNGTCQNTGGAFGSNDTILFASSLFGAGTPTITLQDTLQIGGSGDAALHLAIDAGTGRNVVVERAANAAEHFAVIDARLAYGNARGSLRLTGLIIQGGYANSNTWNAGKYTSYTAGGGIFARGTDLTLERCTIRNNTAETGGGVSIYGDLTVESSVISGNMTPFTFVEGHRGGGGAGILSGNGDLTIRDSTISGNVSNGEMGGAAIVAKYGGFTLENTTISGNSAFETDSVNGGAVISAPTPHTPITLLNSTIACNRGGGNTAAIRLFSAADTRITSISTIFADTPNSSCSTANLAREIAVTTNTTNVEGDSNLVVSASALDASAPFVHPVLVGDPLLGPLQNNGGSTLTHAIAEGSPARNQGRNPAGLAFDQRGADFTRSVGGSPDIGAYEDQVAGFCGSANGGSFASAPTSNLCSAGAALQAPGVLGSGPWVWFCALPSDPVNNEFCGAKVLANASLAIRDVNDQPISTAIWGQPLHLRATVSGSISTPTGTVSFFDTTGGGFTPICIEVALSGGQAVCDTTNAPIASGSRQIEAVYNGSGTHGAASSSPAAIAINPAGSMTAIESQTPNPVTVGTPFTVVADVAVNAPSVGTPFGTIEIYDANDDVSCTYELAAQQPGCALTPAGAGARSLLVTYYGDDNVTGSSVEGVETVAPAATATTIAPSSTAITLGESVSMNAGVASGVPPNIVVPTGSVFVGDAVSGDGCAITLPATSCDWTPHGAGTRTVRGDYSGDVNFLPSSSDSVDIEIAPAATRTSVLLSPASIVLGETVTATAAVVTDIPAGIATPTGTITVDDGVGDTCTVVLPETDCVLTPSSAGEQTITASYPGDANFASSSGSAPLTVSNQPAQLAFTIDDNTDHAEYGETLQYTITLTNSGNGPATDAAVTGTPSDNFRGALVTWTCTPTGGATCAASGSGAALIDTVTLPPTSSVTWTASVAVPTDADGGTIAFSVGAGAAGASDTDVLVLFRDGFE